MKYMGPGNKKYIYLWLRRRVHQSLLMMTNEGAHVVETTYVLWKSFLDRPLSLFYYFSLTYRDNKFYKTKFQIFCMLFTNKIVCV